MAPWAAFMLEIGHVHGGIGARYNSKFDAAADRLHDPLSLSQQCMIVVMMEHGYDPGFLQATIFNNNIPAYICFATNPVMVDFPIESLKLYYTNVLNENPSLVSFLNKFQLSQIDINGLLQALVSLNADSTIGNAPF
ncbi:Aste57867_1656 [Aphanomyces stellatus]|uniref:Aste57867_1656 protein n=1 Tax=Aphanomyces stellatus TaxID=120398 RepID=A0A485K9Z0_9STRA|nr:hypothetical protein As57867_001654 [Aphanomyces stellatus]VFT78868.1 Aste57867_1656 [Aphanomyces stellatus]